MSTYLAICQRAHLLLGIGSRGNTAKPGSVPTSTSSQVDELGEIVAWVSMAWKDIQTEQKWGWLIRRGTLAFTANDNTVIPTATLTNYRELIPFVERNGPQVRQYVLSYITSAGQTNEQRVYFEPWQDFRGFRDRADVATGRPCYFTLKPNQEWMVYPTPDVGYTLRFDYLWKPKILGTGDGSVNIEDWPNVDSDGNSQSGLGLPEEFQDIIAWRAVRMYAETRSRPDLYQIAMQREKDFLRRMMVRYLPTARL